MLYCASYTFYLFYLFVLLVVFSPRLHDVNMKCKIMLLLIVNDCLMSDILTYADQIHIDGAETEGQSINFFFEIFM